MTLTELQKRVVRCLAANRSESSYVAGGIVLNRDWPRISDDMDIFHDTDEEIGVAADNDIGLLRRSGYHVSVEIEIYGCVEAIVSRDGQSTLIQWMSESRTRFFPLVRDEEWGARLHQTDLAINKVVAASTRTKARDFVDLVTIAERMCPLGPVIMGAAGKPPHFSPQRIVDEIRRRGLSIADHEYESVRGLPADWNAETIRDALIVSLDQSEKYLRAAPVELVGVLSVDRNGRPVEAYSLDDPGVIFRRPTPEPEVMPSLPDEPVV